MSEPTERMRSAQRIVTEVTARVNELAEQMPEPVASVAEAIMSFTPEQRENLWAHRTEAMQIVAQHAVEVRAQLEALTRHSRELMTEFQSNIMQGNDERAREIAEWFKQEDDHVGALKTMIEELDALHAELEANPVAPQ